MTTCPLNHVKFNISITLIFHNILIFLVGKYSSFSTTCCELPDIWNDYNTTLYICNSYIHGLHFIRNPSVCCFLFVNAISTNKQHLMFMNLLITLGSFLNKSYAKSTSKKM